MNRTQTDLLKNSVRILESDSFEDINCLDTAAKTEKRHGYENLKLAYVSCFIVTGRCDFSSSVSEILEIFFGFIYPCTMSKVFISYGEKDYKIAKRLYDDLKASGFDPWMNKENILGGCNRKLEIRRAILESSYFLVLLSEKSLSDTGYFHKELKTALEMLEETPPSGMFILPVRLDACKSAYENLQNIQHTDLFPSYEEGLRQILRALETPGDEKESRRFADKNALGTLVGIRIEGGIHQDTSSAPSRLLIALGLIALACLISMLIFFDRPDIEQNIRGNGNTAVITGDGDVSISRDGE